jgi:hypothetical protein
MSFESNIQDGEKPEDAFDRVTCMVQESFDNAIEEALKLLDGVIIQRANTGPKR